MILVEAQGAKVMGTGQTLVERFGLETPETEACMTD